MTSNPLDSATEQEVILNALKDFAEPVGNKEIAEKAGLDVKKVAARMSALKKKGFAESPLRCKYCITDKGRAEIG